MLSLPYGGLQIADGGAGTLAISTTAALVVWGAVTDADSRTRDGDPAVRPDLANNRILLNSPGIYLVHFDLSWLGGAAVDVQAQLFKNNTAVGGLSARAIGASGTRQTVNFTGILEVTAADNPKTVQTFADPSAGTSLNPSYAGAGGAPYTEVPITMKLKTISSTDTVTLEAAHLTCIRLG